MNTFYMWVGLNIEFLKNYPKEFFGHAYTNKATAETVEALHNSWK